MHSQTWQLLPPWLLEPVQQGHLTLTQAAELWDLWLLTPPGKETDVPPHLSSAIEALWLLKVETPPTRH